MLAQDLQSYESGTKAAEDGKGLKELSAQALELIVDSSPKLHPPQLQTMITGRLKGDSTQTVPKTSAREVIQLGVFSGFGGSNPPHLWWLPLSSSQVLHSPERLLLLKVEPEPEVKWLRSLGPRRAIPGNPQAKNGTQILHKV